MGKGLEMMSKDLKSILFTGFLFIVFLLMALEANSFSDKAKFFPFFVALMASLLSLLSIILQTITLIQKRQKESKAVDEAASDIKEVFKYLLWVIGYIVTIYFIGFIFATTLFLLLFLKIESKFKWVPTIFSTGIVIGILLLLERLLNLYWPLGIIFS